MADGMTVTADATELLRAIDQFPDAVARRLLPVAKVTADSIAREAKGRFRRRAAGPTRGGQHTAEGMTVELARSGEGYVIFVKSPEMANLPQWLEFGTKYMTASPYLFPSAELERGPHDRRAREAIQDAIDASGLGE